MRYILHADLNNFYASVESLFNPQYRGLPLVVAGAEEKRHGIVLAKNYLAKNFGIKTGDTLWEARQKCPNLICLQARFGLYMEVSQMVKNVYAEYTDRVESFGIDEAWLDITGRVRDFDEAAKMADEIREKISQTFGITISIGVSFNKIFAKLGSDLKKPDATTLITPQNFKQKIWALPVQELLYVGKSTQKKLNRLGVYTIGELANYDALILKSILGKMGTVLHTFALGQDCRTVALWNDKSVIKSVGNSTTCPKDLTTLDEVGAVLIMLSESVANRMRDKGLFCNCVSLWVKDNELQSFERQKKLNIPTNLASEIYESSMQLFKQNYFWHKPIRALGVRAVIVQAKVIQQNLFESADNAEKREKFEKTIDDVRSRFGYNSITSCSILAHDELCSLNPQSEPHLIHPVAYFNQDEILGYDNE